MNTSRANGRTRSHGAAAEKQGLNHVEQGVQVTRELLGDGQVSPFGRVV